jgi:general secretion pathway protein J
MEREVMAQTSASRGFTLVELLVALFALALLAVLGWRGLDGMVRAQSQLQARADQVLSLQVGLAQWTADLDALEALPRITPLDWNGQVLRLVRRSTQDTASSADGVVVAAWTRRTLEGQGIWLRWQSPALTRRAEVEQAWTQAENWAREPGDADRAGEVRVVPLNQWRVLYFTDDAWREATPGDPQDTETQGAPIPLPDGVRLMLTLPPGGPLAGAITLDWVNPRVSPRRS